MAQFSYEDILNLTYPDLEIEKDFPDKVLREAQFAPFAALTGHDAAVEETARLTERRVELNEDAKAELDRKIRMLSNPERAYQEITVTYFRPDEKKEGGSYHAYTGVAVDIRDYERELVFADGMRIPIEAVIALEGELFDQYYEEDGCHVEL